MEEAEVAPPPPDPKDPPAPWRIRAQAFLWACLCLGMLAYPRVLTPDPRGYGTHEQFFLMPCLFRTLTTLPCPFCGMTTGFAHLVRGDLSAALRAHPGSPLVYLAVAFAAGYCLLWALTGWNPLHRRMGFLLQGRVLGGALLFLWLLAMVARFT